jgi:Ca-activated chloride channel family protein
MSFGAPLWLLTLALVPLAIAAAVRGRRRAKRYAIRFPAMSTLRAAVAAEPSRSRHLPAALALASIALLAVALARPHVTYRAATGSASLMLITDHSGSMAATDVQPTRLAAAARPTPSRDRRPTTARRARSSTPSPRTAERTPATR